MQNGDSAAVEIWRRWANRAEQLAAEFVAESCQRVVKQFQKAAEQPLRGSITGVLALAGHDVSDHEATIRQSQGILRESMPRANMALLWPEDFRNLVSVTRKACEQLMSASTLRSVDFLRHGFECDGSDVEDDGEVDDVDIMDGTRRGFPDFIDWRQDNGRSREPVIVVLGQAEQIPKAMLRDFLSGLGCACCDEGIPLLVMFGLSLPPQGRMELLEDEPLVSLNVVDTVKLFDVDSVLQPWLTEMMKDTKSLLVLPPWLIVALGKKYVEQTDCCSLSQALATFALLLMELIMRSHTGFLCRPLQEDPIISMKNHTSEASWAQSLQSNFKLIIDRGCGEGFLEHPDALSEEGQEWFASYEEAAVSDMAKAKQSLAEVAAQVAMWRTAVVASLPAWEALLCAAQPTVKQASATWRLQKLLQLLWPQKAGPSEAASAAQKESKEVAELIATCLKAAQGLELASLQALAQELRNCAPALPAKVQAELPSLLRSTEYDQSAVLLAELRTWFTCVQKGCWQPLTSEDARCLFVYGFCTSDARVQEAWKAVEAKVGGGVNHYGDRLLKPLAHGSCAQLDDMALLYRLLECAERRSVALSSMWAAFQDQVSKSIEAENAKQPSKQKGKVAQQQPIDESVLRQRFGHALLVLRTLGLATPYRCQKLGEGGFSDWRLRKRLSGRMWYNPRSSGTGPPSWEPSQRPQQLQHAAPEEDEMTLVQLATSASSVGPSEDLSPPKPNRPAELCLPLTDSSELEIKFGLKRHGQEPAAGAAKVRRKEPRTKIIYS